MTKQEIHNMKRLVRLQQGLVRLQQKIIDGLNVKNAELTTERNELKIRLNQIDDQIEAQLIPDGAV